jgi:glucose-6-phosphate 1-dehydrogenase
MYLRANRNARVGYEKPFGTSPDSFRELDRVVHSVPDEQQVDRIDHFLGKEDLHHAPRPRPPGR